MFKVEIEMNGVIRTGTYTVYDIIYEGRITLFLIHNGRIWIKVPSNHCTPINE